MRISFLLMKFQKKIANKFNSVAIRNRTIDRCNRRKKEHQHMIWDHI